MSLLINVAGATPAGVLIERHLVKLLTEEVCVRGLASSPLKPDVLHGSAFGKMQLVPKRKVRLCVCRALLAFFINLQASSPPATS